MSISARIAAVTVIDVGQDHLCDTCKGSGNDPEDHWDDCPTCHGATVGHPRVRLKLEPRQKGELAGQPVLTIVNPPTTDPSVLSGLVGVEIWGGSGEVMIGEKKWANRIGYTRIELIEQPEQG